MAYKNGERSVLLELARLAQMTELVISRELKSVVRMDQDFISRVEKRYSGSQSRVRRVRGAAVVALHNSGQPEDN